MTSEIPAEFNSSFKFDRQIFAADIRISIAYCDELFGAGVFTRLEAERAKNALYSILKRADYDKNYFSELKSENVHDFIETRLIQLIGETGRKLSVGRSRIDQSGTALRLWLREEIEEISKFARNLQYALLEIAEKHRDAVLPGYTHLRRTKPILWAHWCLAYFEMLARDRERLDETWRRVNVLPLGSANIAGTTFEIDRELIAKQLKFEGVSANSLDAVSDADYAVEFIGACALLMIHLSRLAEDLIIYSTSEFGFVTFGQSKSKNFGSDSPNTNLKALELIRGKAGRIIGHHTALLSTLKNLPLAFNQDLQETQEAVFDTVDTVSVCLKTAQIVVLNLQINTKNSQFATLDYLNSEELSDYLIQRNLPIAAVEQIVEQILAYAVSANKQLEELSLAEMKKFSEVIEKDVFNSLSLEQTLASKNKIGGTSPERVFEALEYAKEVLDREAE